jgi:hypothetical protein
MLAIGDVSFQVVLSGLKTNGVSEVSSGLLEKVDVVRK